MENSRDDWATPEDLFEKIQEKYRLEIDACATPENSKLPRFWTPEQDGLSKPWSYKRVFCNPPYSQKTEWIQKAVYEVKERGCTIVVLLLPASTDTRWFHDVVFESGVCSELVLLSPRISFEDPTGDSRSSPPHGSCLIVLRRGRHRPRLVSWRWKQK